MNDWCIPYCLLRLAVLGVAALAIPTLVWRRVGGRPASYVSILAGVAALAFGDSLFLAAALRPDWSAEAATIGGRFPIYGCGFALVLLGFLLLMNDLKRRQDRDREAAADERARAQAARLDEARLRAILDGATDYCIITSDPRGLITSYSGGGRRILGWETAEVVGKMNVGQLHPPDQPVTAAGIMALVTREGRLETEVVMVRKDGRRVPVLLTVTPLADAAGRVEGFIGVAKDITEMRAAREALRRERDFVRGLLETNELFIVGASLVDGRVTMFNQGAERISGYRREEIIGRPYDEVFVLPDDRPRTSALLDSIRQGTLPPLGQHESRIVTKSGEPRLIAWTYTATADDQGRLAYAVGFGHDVTRERRMQTSLQEAKRDLEEANAALARLATTDYLTGLLNRRQADLLLEREILRARRLGTPLSLVLADLDGFKRVNDTYGHEAGDVCLRHVADRLRERLRATDIVARHGGEEFLIVLPETAREEAARLAEAVCRLIGEGPVARGGHDIRMALSAGVATMDPGETISAIDLLRRADAAMYRAKALGGNGVKVWRWLHAPAAAGTT